MTALSRLPGGRLEEQFEEKKPAYTEAEAVAEANRCIYCADAPCIQACPTSIDIPSFIRKIGTGNVKGAARTILSANLLGESCGQVCPVEVLCAGACVYNQWGREPIRIGRLQRHAVEQALAKDPRLLKADPPTGKKVALVGAGPASIAAAGWLALLGHRAVIFERKAIPGGLNTLGIAPYKMKGDQAIAEIEWVLSLGDIELRTGAAVVAAASGPGEIAAHDLLRDYDAVFLGLGLGADSWLSIPGAAGQGVAGATDFIEKIKSDPSLRLDSVKKAVVVGGGNTAVDIAHELALLGVDTVMVYRRSAADMSAYDHEMAGGRLDGVRLIDNRIPREIIRTGGKVTGLSVIHGENGRPIPDRVELLPADLVVFAIGQNRTTELARAFEGVRTDDRGRVIVDPATHRTGNPRVWSGGDCVNGGKEVVNAVAEAKVAVKSMHQAMMGA
jgi:glutamate synthase (NADPH/NADH) small chain